MSQIRHFNSLFARYRFGVPFAFFFLAMGVCPAAHVNSGPLNINGQNGVTLENLHITSSNGPCLVITNSTNITIHNSEIGPCGATAVSVTGSDTVKVLDNYIHAEVPGIVTYPGNTCCDTGVNLYLTSTTHLLVQGNVIAWGESNIILYGSTGAIVKGNFLLNPLNHGNRGQQMIFYSGSNNGVADGNYLLSSKNTALYRYAENQEDAINDEAGTSGVTIKNNYINGGHSGSGCGVALDSGSSSANVNHNTLIDTGECGIGVADGTYHVVDSNKIVNSTPVAGGGNTAIAVWKIYPNDPPCNNITVSNNIASELKPDMTTESGFWYGGGCDPTTLTNNVFDSAARAQLTPVSSKLPPPMIPPAPFSCAAVSPFTNQTAQSCNGAVLPVVSLVSPGANATVSGMVQATASASADVTNVKFYVDGTQMLGQATTAPWSISANTTGMTNGNHAFTAVAGNSSGVQTTSSPVTVVIQNLGPAPPPPPSNLNKTIWTFLGNGTYSTNGTDLLLTAPAGANHDPAFGGADNAVRVTQNIGNSDFLVEVKFDSIPTAQYQFEGVLVHQDAANYLRFQFGSTGNALVVGASKITGSSETGLFSPVITLPSGTSSLWMRIQKTGDTWAQSWSADGSTYTSAGSFTQALIIANIGPFAGNYSSVATSAPAFTAAVDYFVNRTPPAAGPPVSDTFNQ